MSIATGKGMTTKLEQEPQRVDLFPSYSAHSNATAEARLAAAKLDRCELVFGPARG